MFGKCFICGKIGTDRQGVKGPFHISCATFYPFEEFKDRFKQLVTTMLGEKTNWKYMKISQAPKNEQRSLKLFLLKNLPWEQLAKDLYQIKVKRKNIYGINCKHNW